MLHRLTADNAVLLHQLQYARCGRAAHLERVFQILLEYIALFFVYDQVMDDHRLHAGHIRCIRSLFGHTRHLPPKQIMQHADFCTDAVVRVSAAFIMVTAIHC